MATNKTTSKQAKKTADKAKASTASAKADVKKLTPTERAEKAEAKLNRAEATIDKLKDQLDVSKQVSGFVDFLREQSVVGLAVGLVLGTQVKAVVDQIVADFINPLTSLILPGKGELQSKIFTLHLNGKHAVFAWGSFANSLLTFVIVAAVVYYTFKALRLDKLSKKKDS